MRLVKLLTYYTVPLLVLTLIFLPAENTGQDSDPDRPFKVAQALFEQYDDNNDQVLYPMEFPLQDFEKYDFNKDSLVSQSELQYALDYGTDQKFGNYAFYEALPDEEIMDVSPRFLSQRLSHYPR